MSEKELNMQWLKDRLKDYFCSNELLEEILKICSEQYIEGLQQGKFDCEMDYVLWQQDIEMITKLRKENDVLQQRINKTIEYIKNHCLLEENNIIQGYLDPKEICTTLDLLIGKND